MSNERDVSEDEGRRTSIIKQESSFIATFFIGLLSRKKGYMVSIIHLDWEIFENEGEGSTIGDDSSKLRRHRWFLSLSIERDVEQG